MALSSFVYVFLSFFFAAFVPFAIWPTQSLRWLRRKQYQYEVTFALSMMTTAEKLVLNFIFLTIGSLFLTAAALYLPQHISIIGGRALYYWRGSSLSGLGGRGSGKGALDGLSAALLHVRGSSAATSASAAAVSSGAADAVVGAAAVLGM